MVEYHKVSYLTIQKIHKIIKQGGRINKRFILVNLSNLILIVPMINDILLQQHHILTNYHQNIYKW